jgi:hypothetical protein
MSRNSSIKNAVLHAFKCGTCGGSTGTRRSVRLPRPSLHRRIEIAGARVTCFGSKKSSSASVTAAKEQFTHGEVREMAEALVEAIANGDLLTATYALKACLVPPWPRGIFLSICQETLNRLSNADSIDWDKPLAEFHYITCSYRNKEQAQYAKDIAFAGQWLLGRYKHLTGRDPLSDFAPNPDGRVNDLYHAVLSKSGKTFADIRCHLIEGHIDRDCERIKTFVLALERMSALVNAKGVNAVAMLADKLNSKPERIRNGYVRLYAAIDIALTKLVGGDPACQAPEYYNPARDLVMKLQTAPSDPDEELIEAAWHVLRSSGVKQRINRTAEIDDTLAKLVSLTEGRNRNADRAEGTSGQPGHDAAS